MRFCAGVVVLGGLFAVPVHVHAQQQTRTASVAVSLRVLPRASFEGGADRPFSVDVVPGEVVEIAPSAGVRTQMSYSAPVRVHVSGGELVGPDGAVWPVRLVCSFGAAKTVSGSERIDCADGVVTDGARLGSIPLAVGVELSGRTTRGMGPGMYVGRVVMTASHSTY